MATAATAVLESAAPAASFVLAGPRPAVRPARDFVTRRWPLVGRVAELQRMATQLQSPAGALVLAGPSGVGKTRLAEECLALAASSGFATARVLGTQAASSLPLGAYAPLLPDLPAGTDRTEVLRQIARAIPERGEGKRVALLVDDAHLLDQGSAALTHQLASGGDTFVVATVRSGEPASDAVVALWKDGLAERLDVCPLSVDQVGELLTAVLGSPADRATLQRLWERTEGNPLFLRELVVAAVETGVLRDRGGLWRLEGTLPASDRLVELVEGRLVGLPDEERRALEVLAVWEPMSVEPFERLDEHGCLPSLERQRLVRLEADGRRVTVRLAHLVYGEVLRARLGPRRTRQLYRAMAETLEGTGARRREDLLRLATWRLDAGGADVELLLKGTAQARQRFDYTLGERLARAAAEAGGGFPARLALAQLMCLQGRGAEAEEQLAGLAAEASNEETRARVAAVRVENLRFLGRYDEGRAVAESALESVTDRTWKDELEASRAGILIDTAGPATAAAVAEDLCTRSSGRALVWASVVATYSLGRAGRLGASQAAAERAAAARAALTGPRDDRLEATRRLALVEAMSGAGYYHEAEEAATSEYEGAVVRGALEAQAWAAGQLAKLSLGQGRAASAARYAHEAATLNIQLNRPTYLRESLVSLATAEAILGRAKDAAATLAEIDDLALARSWWTEVDLLIARAWQAVAAGDISGAREMLSDAASRGTDVGDMVRVCAALHDLARLGSAAVVAPRLAALAEVIEGPLPAARAAHTTALAQRDAARLESCSSVFTEIGADLLAAEAAADAAVAWRKHGDSRRAAAAERRSHSLAARCEGARTPALTAVTARAALAARELEIARLAAAGLGNAEIAARLYLSPRTVENKLHATYEKLGIEGRRELAEALEGY